MRFARIVAIVGLLLTLTTLAPAANAQGSGCANGVKYYDLGRNNSPQRWEGDREALYLQTVEPMDNGAFVVGEYEGFETPRRLRVFGQMTGSEFFLMIFDQNNRTWRQYSMDMNPTGVNMFGTATLSNGDRVDARSFYGAATPICY